MLSSTRRGVECSGGSLDGGGLAGAGVSNAGSAVAEGGPPTTPHPSPLPARDTRARPLSDQVPTSTFCSRGREKEEHEEEDEEKEEEVGEEKEEQEGENEEEGEKEEKLGGEVAKKGQNYDKNNNNA
ncbi:hypothetical protein LSTR_LSTR005191 [Laodelphax striatellus]|uniref:Uncharacterized protein n=1 Tax=Laodelphax striatellus TaxID=195883 RepID=A0A482XMN9_LAOST|nr:hypothetical protein LSTR_LSTR005191 [Laodelphax striatellus]